MEQITGPSHSSVVELENIEESTAVVLLEKTVHLSIGGTWKHIDTLSTAEDQVGHAVCISKGITMYSHM